MPAYQMTDPRHPVNRARAAHQAAIEEWGVGEVILMRQVKRLLRVGLGLCSEAAVRDYLLLMRDHGMVDFDDDKTGRGSKPVKLLSGLDLGGGLPQAQKVGALRPTGA